MIEDPIKIQLDSSTYVTKVNGKLVMVRERRERLRDLCIDLLGEALGKYSRLKMKKYSKKPEGENIPAQNPGATPFKNFPTPQLFNPNANLVGPAPVQSIMGPMGPQPGIYRFGNRQMALLPLNPQGGPVVSPQMGLPYPQLPWVYPQGPNMSGVIYPPMGTDPRQVITNPAPPSEVSSQTSVTVTKHVCAECGSLRSRKYQHEHPLKPGETPSPAFCKKCQKDVTSTEESDTTTRDPEKQHNRSKKGRKKATKLDYEIDSSKNWISPAESQKVLKPKHKKCRNETTHDKVIPGEQRAKRVSRRLRSYLYEDEDYVPGWGRASPPPEEVRLARSRSSSSPHGHEIGPPDHQSHVNHQVWRPSRDRVATDAAEVSHHIRSAPSQSTYEKYEIDSVSIQSRTNEESVSSDKTARKIHSLKDPFIGVSRTRSEDASRRRRLERSIDRQEIHEDATGLTQGIHPSEENEVVVVTERYVYRPRQLSHVQQEDLEDRRQITMEKAKARAKTPYPHFAAETEASDYYRNGWTGHERSGPERVRPRDLEGLRGPANSHSSDTSSGSRYRASSDEYFVPQPPSPLRPLRKRGKVRAQIDQPRHEAAYLPGKAEGLPSPGNEIYTQARDRGDTIRGRSSRSTYRPPYVREATDRGTERALLPLSTRSHERLFCTDMNDSEATEEVERVERHVTFRDLHGYEEGYDILNEKLASLEY